MQAALLDAGVDLTRVTSDAERVVLADTLTPSLEDARCRAHLRGVEIESSVPAELVPPDAVPAPPPSAASAPPSAASPLSESVAGVAPSSETPLPPAQPSNPHATIHPHHRIRGSYRVASRSELGQPAYASVRTAPSDGGR